MTTEPWDPTSARATALGRLRASDADREQAIDIIKAAFVQGRLSQDELGLRAGQALTSRTYAELTAVTADIMAARLVGEARPAPRAVPARTRAPVRARVVALGACAIIALPALGAAFLTFYGRFIILFLFAFVGLAVTAGP